MPSGLDDRDAVCWLEATVYMRNQLLRDTDGMGMACSVEIRPPFLDQEFAAFAWAAGPAWRDGKRRLVAALGNRVPSGVLEGGKRGFNLPFDSWLTGALRQDVEQRLSELPALFEPRAVQSLWARFLEAPARVGWSRPWSLFVLANYLDLNRISP
jgi:asparagine synthase (glutamine-hydrolysing)